MKHRPPLFLIVVVIFATIILVNTAPIFSQTIPKTDKQIAKEYCKKNYPNCRVKIVKKYNPKIMENRKGKNIVYVERFVSYSKGKYGLSKKGEYVKYNKRVKKGKKVVSYFVYNPYTNYFDDVVAVIDCKKIR